MVLFLLKILDSMLYTFKVVYISKGQRVLASLFNATSTFVSTLIVMKLAKADSIPLLMLVCIATFVGNYVSLVLVDRLERGRIFVYDITPETDETGEVLADELRRNGVPIKTRKEYNKARQFVLCCKAYAETKADGHRIESILDEMRKETKEDIKSNVSEAKTHVG